MIYNSLVWLYTQRTYGSFFVLFHVCLGFSNVISICNQVSQIYICEHCTNFFNSELFFEPWRWFCRVREFEASYLILVVSVWSKVTPQKSIESSSNKSHIHTWNKRLGVTGISLWLCAQAAFNSWIVKRFFAVRWNLLRAFLSQILYNTKREPLLSCDTFHSSLCVNFWMLELLCEMWGQFRHWTSQSFFVLSDLFVPETFVTGRLPGHFPEIILCVWYTDVCCCLNATIPKLFTSHDDTKQNLLLLSPFFHTLIF